MTSLESERSVSGEHTPSPESRAIRRPFRERKTKVDGSVHEYSLELLAEAPGFAAARYRIAKAGPARFPVRIPAGASSDGYFWEARPYIVYRMRDPDGRLIVHRFDAVANVVIDSGGVSYDDLVLDWWVLPDGTVVEEDADELAALVASGRIESAHAERILANGRAAQGAAQTIIVELETLERTPPPVLGGSRPSREGLA